MSSFISVAEAQGRLAELVENLIPGEELFLTVDDHPIAKLVRTAICRPTNRASRAARSANSSSWRTTTRIWKISKSTCSGLAPGYPRFPLAHLE